MYLYLFNQKNVVYSSKGEFARSLGLFCNVSFLLYFPSCPVTRLLLILWQQFLFQYFPRDRPHPPTHPPMVGHHTSKKQESWDSRLRKSSLRQLFRFLDVCHLPSHPLPHSFSFCNFSTDVTNCSASIEKKLLFSWVCFSAMCQSTSKIARQTFFICSYNLILILICSSWMKLMWIFVVAVCCWIMICSQCWGQLDRCLTWHLFVRWIFLVLVYWICGIQT